MALRPPRVIGAPHHSPADRGIENSKQAPCSGALSAQIRPPPRNDALYDGEPDAGSREVFDRMQTLKDTKQLVGVAHIEAGAIVLHSIDGLPILDPATDFNPGLRSFGAV